jgi:hypothetical protein
LGCGRSPRCVLCALCGSSAIRFLAGLYRPEKDQAKIETVLPPAFLDWGQGGPEHRRAEHQAFLGVLGDLCLRP